MSTNYSQYLGARRCCDLRVQGAQGPQGAQGAASVGPVGYQGATGAQGYQGATGRGCAGPTGAQGLNGVTGPQGVTGPSQWIPMNGLGTTGGGYTGIGITGQDVLIYGNLLVTGGIDPTYLALTPQASGPTGFVNPLWVDNIGNLRSEQILLSNGTNTLTIDKTSITHTNATLPLSISSNGDIDLTSTSISPNGKISVNATNGIVINQQGLTPPDTTITTLNGNTIEIYEDKNTSVGLVNQLLINTAELYIDNTDNTNQTDSYSRVSPNQLELYDHTSSGTNTSRLLISSEVFEYQRSGTKPAYYQFNYLTNEVFRMAINGIIMGSSGTGVKLNANNIQYPATFNNTSANISTTSSAVQTFNGALLTATLFNASATNVGTQFTITNTAITNLTVTTTGGTQLIYSSTGAASATSRTLATGHSHIFTAILTTGASTFGWSMV
jgi:hypothetical protein